MLLPRFIPPLRLKLPPPSRLILLDPPRLKPPPPRPPPPPPRPPRASAASNAVKVARLRQAPTIARRNIERRMLTSCAFVSGKTNLLRVGTRHECEVGIGKGRVQLPGETSDERRPGRI